MQTKAGCARCVQIAGMTACSLRWVSQKGRDREADRRGPSLRELTGIGFPRDAVTCQVPVGRRREASRRVSSRAGGHP